MAEKDEYSTYEIKGSGDSLRAVLSLVYPRGSLERGKPPTRQDVFNEQSLADRVTTLERNGWDASMSRSALVSLRAHKAEASPG